MIVNGRYNGVEASKSELYGLGMLSQDQHGPCLLHLRAALDILSQLPNVSVNEFLVRI